MVVTIFFIVVLFDFAPRSQPLSRATERGYISKLYENQIATFFSASFDTRIVMIIEFSTLPQHHSISRCIMLGVR